MFRIGQLVIILSPSELTTMVRATRRHDAASWADEPCRRLVVDFGAHFNLRHRPTQADFSDAKCYCSGVAYLSGNPRLICAHRYWDHVSLRGSEGSWGSRAHQLKPAARMGRILTTSLQGKSTLSSAMKVSTAVSKPL